VATGNWREFFAWEVAMVAVEALHADDDLEASRLFEEH